MRTILWDMDGTLADTEEMHYGAWHATMTELEIDYPYATFLADFGKNNREILSRLFGSEATPERIRTISRRKEAAFRHLLAQQPVLLMPGVAEWLERMDAEGVQQVVSSSGTMANIVALVHSLQIGNYFRSIVSGYALPQGKPHPAVFLNSAVSVGTTPACCIVIEDSLAGIEAARRAGMASIAVGKLAHSPHLAELLARVAGPVCLSAPALADVQWQDFETLWAASHAANHVRAIEEAGIVEEVGIIESVQ